MPLSVSPSVTLLATANLRMRKAGSYIFLSFLGPLRVTTQVWPVRELLLGRLVGACVMLLGLLVQFPAGPGSGFNCGFVSAPGCLSLRPVLLSLPYEAGQRRSLDPLIVLCDIVCI